MKEFLLCSLLSVAIGFFAQANAKDKYETDTFDIDGDELQITFYGHASLSFAFQGKMIYVDPYSNVADYQGLPKADLILITHEHRDHLDQAALQHIRAEQTIIIVTEAAAQTTPNSVIMKNGDAHTAAGLNITAVPAYNIISKRENGEPYHPKGAGNGYVITFGKKRVYVAGDTEFIPEMKELKNIDIAFLPMNLPFTMTPEMAADAAKCFTPAILYPYHTGETETAKLVDLLQDTPEITVRIRKMK